MTTQSIFSHLLKKAALLARKKSLIVVGFVLLFGTLSAIALSTANKGPTVTVNAAQEDPTPTPSPVHFAVIGDFGCGCTPELDVANLVNSWNPEFIVTTGDNNYELGEASTIDAHIGQYYHSFISPYNGTYGSGSDINRFFPSIGNHDWGDGFVQPPTVQPYTDYFTLPNNERYYDVVWGSVHIFVIDSDTHEPDGTSSTSVQATWLQNRLAASTALWKIVVFHHPPYASGDHGSSSWMRWPFAEWGATAVLSGHNHMYERVQLNNIVYFVNGLGGGGRDAIDRPPVAGSQRRYFADHGAMLVDANNEGITFQFITRAGTLIDTYSIYTVPSAHMPAAPTNLSAGPSCSTQLSLSWVDNASNEDGYKIEQSTDGTNFTEVGSVAANVNTYTPTNLLPSTTYYYRVKAFNALGDTAFTNTANYTTTASSATAPSNLSAATTSSTRITLSWADNICSELGFKIERSPDGTTFAEIANVGANITSYVNTGLAPSSGYYYRVRAYDAQSDSEYSNVAFGTTGPPPPVAPSNLSATAVSASQINLSWADNSNSEDSFRIYRSSDGGSFFWYYTVDANVTTYSDTGRNASTTYYYRVAAHNSGGDSSQSNTASATTFPPPPAPSGLSATAVSGTQINLSWTDNSTDEDGFKIYRSTDAVNFAFYASVGTNVTTRSNTNLTGNTNYYYRVLAYNAGGSSAYSDTASATTLPLPAAPSNLAATAVSSGQINLSWTDNSNNESGFRIYRSTDGVNFLWYYTPGANATSFSDTGRTAGTLYYYRVLSYNANGISDFSNTASATTFPLPAAPSNLTATAISKSRIDLAWVDNSNNEDGFKIYRSTDGVNFTFYATVGANVTTRSNTNLTSGTTYYYRVFAYNSGGNSADSNVASATTLP
jgi:fibronectin type 3 domain-containing protein